MICPYCKGNLQLQDEIEANDEEITHGIVDCACTSYPILAGILNLRYGRLFEQIVRRLRERKRIEAIGLGLEERMTETTLAVINTLRSKGIYGKALAQTFLRLLELKAQRAYERFADEDASFHDLMGRSDFETYLKHRFSLESFWSLYPFLRLLKENSHSILDFGCGTGHGSFVISTYAKPNELVCVDYSLRNLLMVKKFFAPNAECICLDGNYPLPFESEVFDSILTLDSFHYVRNQASLAQEMQRVLKDKGVLLMLHLHNSLAENPSAGHPLPPRTIASLLRDLPLQMLPERELLQEFLEGNCLDLRKTHSETELDSSEALTIVASRNNRIFRHFHDVANEFLSCDTNLIVNPIYQIKHENTKIILRHFPNESFRKEFPIAEKYLPPQWTLDNEFASKMHGRKLARKLTQVPYSTYEKSLMMKFIIINAPERYISNSS